MSTNGTSASPEVRALIAEDEPLLAEELVERLAELWPQLQIAARVEDGVAALHAVEREAPQVAFLDIEMPRLKGLDVARQIAGRCHVVFITAFDAYAVRAFEAGALDYVLKPFDTARLATTVRRLKERVHLPAPDLSERLRGADAAAAPGGYLQWINAQRGSAVRLITVDEVCYFKSDHKYTLVVTADAEALIKKTIKELTEELDPGVFWQIHRSTVVNVHAIDCVVRDDRGSLSVQLKGRPERLAVSDQYRAMFRQM